MEALKTVITDNDIYKYLKTNWEDTEGYSDFNLALERGLLEYAAWLIKGAGAIDSNACFDWAKPYERAIEAMLDGYTDEMCDKDRETLLKGIEVWVNEDNEHWFIDKQHHAVTTNDLIQWGFKKS